MEFSKLLFYSYIVHTLYNNFYNFILKVFFNVMLGAMGVGQTAPYFEAFALARGAAGKIFSIIERVFIIFLYLLKLSIYSKKFCYK